MFDWLAKKLDTFSVRTRWGQTLQRRTYEWEKEGYPHQEAEQQAKQELFAAMRAAGFSFGWRPQEVDTFCQAFLETPLSKAASEESLRPRLSPKVTGTKQPSSIFDEYNLTPDEWNVVGSFLATAFPAGEDGAWYSRAEDHGPILRSFGAMALSGYALEQAALGKLEIAIRAARKAYRIHPLPIYIFELAQLVEERQGLHSAAHTYLTFLEEQSAFNPTAIEQSALRMQDVAGAISEAESRLRQAKNENKPGTPSPDLLFCPNPRCECEMQRTEKQRLTPLDALACPKCETTLAIDIEAIDEHLAEPLASDKAEGEEHGELSPASILIIDGEATIRESLTTLLELEGYEVESAEAGEPGLARLGNRPFDLVLLDFALPGRNGVEVLRDIRDRDPELAVIMITAYGTVENAVQAMQAGATNFIQKPWDNEKLLADVRAAVARRRAEENVLPDQVVGRGLAAQAIEHRPDASLFDLEDDFTRCIVVDMLEKTHWNQTEAAERFRVPLSTLNQKIKRLNIEIRKKSKE